MEEVDTRDDSVLIDYTLPHGISSRWRRFNTHVAPFTNAASRKRSQILYWNVTWIHKQLGTSRTFRRDENPLGKINYHKYLKDIVQDRNKNKLEVYPPALRDKTLYSGGKEAILPTHKS